MFFMWRFCLYKPYPFSTLTRCKFIAILLKSMDTKNKLNLGLLIAASALPSSALQANPGSKLEPVYLANVALYLNDETILRKLPFVSKNGQTALKMLRENPIPLTQSNYKLFPNINTRVLFSFLERYDIKDIKNTKAINENIRNEFFKKIDADENAGVITLEEANVLKEEVEQFIENITAHVYGHRIDYKFYRDHNLTKHNVASGIIFTQEDRIAYSNEFQQPIPNTRFFKYNIPLVTHLGPNCFVHCHTLQNINIPDSVTSLGRSCFDNCTVLQDITFNNNSAISLGDDCFAYCCSLQNITFPKNSVILFGNRCFANCYLLQNITFDDNSATSLGDGCFINCHSLQSITIPNFATSLGNRCFAGCSSLQSVTIPNSVTSLGCGCFAGCRALQNITIPNSVTSLGRSCFYGCSRLQNITIPDSIITSLDNRCFDCCSALRNITIIDTGKKNIEDIKDMLIDILIDSDLDPDAIQITIIPQQQ